MKNLKELLDCILEKRELYFTKKFTYDPQVYCFEEEDRAILDILIDIYQHEYFYKRDKWGHHSHEREITIPPFFADDLLVRLQKRPCVFGNISDHPNRQINWVEDELPYKFALDLHKGKKDYELDLHQIKPSNYYADYGYIISDDHESIYKLNQAQKQVMDRMSKLVQHGGKPFIPIKAEQLNAFLSNVAPHLKKVGNLDISEQIANKVVDPSLHAKLYLDYVEERLTAKIQYHYDEIMINPLQIDQADQQQTSNILIRDIEKEHQVMNLIERASFKFNGNELYLDEENHMFTFLYEFLPRVKDEIDIYMTDRIKKLMFEKHSEPSINVNLDSNSNLLDIRFDFSGIDQAEMNQIIHSVIEKKRYHRLSNGAFLSLEKDSFAHISELCNELNLKPDEFSGEKVTVPAYRSLQVDEWMQGAAEANYNRSFRQLIRDIKHPEDSEAHVPQNLNATLRDYQLTGFQWLKSLSHYNFGGILADDMGLGKTLQGIALLLSEREDNHSVNTALVVSPASLVYNWENELNKFSSDLNVQVMSGNKQERTTILEDLTEIDVLITSYPMVRQDIDQYKTKEFSTLILDEAQAIKNPGTKISKAIRSIHVGKRFALSGTPIENSLDELWALFDAILPGLFSNKKNFKSIPHERISRMSRPFILRRIKKDVLKELPEKIESVYHSELTTQQKQLYIGYLKFKGKQPMLFLRKGFRRVG